MLARLLQVTRTVGRSLRPLRRDEQGLAILAYALGSVFISVPIVIGMGFFGSAAADQADADMADLAVAVHAQADESLQSNLALDELGVSGPSMTDVESAAPGGVDAPDTCQPAPNGSETDDELAELIAIGCTVGSS